jgi:hypothetical protein
MIQKEDFILELFSNYISENSVLREEKSETDYASMIKSSPYFDFNITMEKSLEIMQRIGLSYIQTDGSDAQIAIDTISKWRSVNSNLKDILPMNKKKDGYASNLSANKTVEVLKMILLTSLKSNKISFKDGIRISTYESKDDEFVSYFTISNQ